MTAEYVPTLAYVRDSFCREFLKDQGLDEGVRNVKLAQDAWHRWFDSLRGGIAAEMLSILQAHPDPGNTRGAVSACQCGEPVLSGLWYHHIARVIRKEGSE